MRIFKYTKCFAMFIALLAITQTSQAACTAVTRTILAGGVGYANIEVEGLCAIGDAGLVVNVVSDTPPPTISNQDSDWKPWHLTSRLSATLYYYPGPEINIQHCVEDDYEEWIWNEYEMEYAVIPWDYPRVCYIPANY